MAIGAAHLVIGKSIKRHVVRIHFRKLFGSEMTVETTRRIKGRAMLDRLFVQAGGIANQMPVALQSS
jgi:hypothetical protein